MKTEVLIQLLRNRDEQLCTIAADELQKLWDEHLEVGVKYKELGDAYDAMSTDYIYIANMNRNMRIERMHLKSRIKELEESKGK